MLYFLKWLEKEEKRKENSPEEIPMNYPDKKKTLTTLIPYVLITSRGVRKTQNCGPLRVLLGGGMIDSDY